MSRKIELIEQIEIHGSHLVVQVHSDLKPTWFKEDFWLTVQGTDLTKIPEQVLLIPFYLNAAPVIWISGEDVVVEKMDASLFAALRRVKAALVKMYPALEWGGQIEVNNIVATEKFSHERISAMLFSGGLDSVASSYRHFDEKQVLVTVRGSDIALDDEIGWKTVRSATSAYAESIGADYFFLESNFYQFLNQSYLGSICVSVPAWWAYVQHGMGLSGLMAIPAWLKKAKRAYIAATHSYAFGDTPWGSTPKIDDEIEWFGVRVEHDCFDLTRQGKVELICRKVAAGAKPPFLRVCYSSRGGTNCCLCEKCCRTMSGLLVAGHGYREFGFDLSEDSFIKNVYRALDNKRFPSDKNMTFHWMDIQTRIKSELFYRNNEFSCELINYINWLKGFDFVRYERAKVRSSEVKKRAIKIARAVPGLYAVLSFVKRKIR